MSNLPTLEDLKAAKFTDLQKLHKDVIEALAHVQAKAKNDAKNAIMEKAVELGFSLNELFEGLGEKTAKAAKAAPIAAKYEHPENPAETWSGRGRKPRWLADLIEKGHDLEEYLIK